MLLLLLLVVLLLLLLLVLLLMLLLLLLLVLLIVELTHMKSVDGPGSLGELSIFKYTAQYSSHR